MDKLTKLEFVMVTGVKKLHRYFRKLQTRTSTPRDRDQWDEALLEAIQSQQILISEIADEVRKLQLATPISDTQEEKESEKIPG